MNGSNDFSRRHRVQYPGALYHITSRGVDRQNIYRDDLDRQEFFRLMERTVDRFAWEVYAITLMSNHFHLYFRTPKPNLSRGAQYLLGNYASAFNRRHQRDGHLLQGRFRYQVIESERYAWGVSRYVHLNPYPVLVDHPARWPWGSYAGYCDPGVRLPWIQYDALLSAWEGDFGAGSGSYRSFVEAGMQQTPVSSPFAEAVDGWILGSDTFVSRMRQLVCPKSNEPTITRTRAKSVELSIIVKAVCEEFAIDEAQLRLTRSRYLSRAILAHWCREIGACTMHDIAPVLGLSRRDCVPSLARKVSNAPEDSLIRQRAEAVLCRIVKDVESGIS